MIRLLLLSALFVAGLAAQPARAVDEQPLLVTYGADTALREGDHDYKQVIRFSVPDRPAEKLYVRIFDPDTVGRHDSAFGWWNTTTRFSVYAGGNGGGISRDAAGVVQENPKGRLLARRDFALDWAIDNSWVTLAEITVGKGALVNGRREFFLLVQGLSGNDGNVYSVAVSRSGSENFPPEDLRVFSYVPNVRVPRRGFITELPLFVPEAAKMLRFENFDTAEGMVEFASRFRTVELEASAQGNWRAMEIAVDPEEKGRLASVTLAGGREIPNDITFHVSDGEGRPLPIAMPPRLVAANRRPVARYEIVPLSCSEVRLDASASFDPDVPRRRRGQDPVRHVWRFHDGATAEGASVSRSYDTPGKYPVRLEVFDTSGRIANGAAENFTLDIKPPPSASITLPAAVPLGVPVELDGSASATTPGAAIARYVWQLEDGTTLEGAKVSHVFATPGRHLIKLSVTDDSGHRCDSDEDEFAVTVNAPPVAHAGGNRRAAAGEAIIFDAAGSSDPDGEISSYIWSFSDGTRASGPRVEKSFAEPGEYSAVLVVSDAAGIANSQARTEIAISVNAQPVARIAGPEKLVVGQIGRFDGSGSADPDGSILRYDWDFGDGHTASGRQIEHSFWQAGTYQLRLTVSDDSELPNASAVAEHTVIVAERDNLPPVVSAGNDRTAHVNEVLRFDATASHDPDGNIIAFAWDFGDGASASGPTPLHSYSAPGNYRVKVTARDDSGRPNDSTEAVFTVAVSHAPNQPPVPAAGPDMTAVTAQLLQFDAGGSTDPDGSIISHRWDFGDGTSSLERRPVHAYSRPGSYTVTLTVKDDSGRPNDTVSDSLTVSVTERPNTAPVAVAGDDMTVEVRDLIVFDGTGSSDADGSLIGYHWDFGNGDSASGPEPAYAYPKTGRYKVTLTVTDNSGQANASSSDEFWVTVKARPNVPPVAEAGADRRAAFNEVVAFDAGASHDPDGYLIDYRWDFGDGATAGGPKVSHAFAKPGRYIVTLTVTDDSELDNNTSADTRMIWVNDPPVADAGPDQYVSASVVEFDGTGSSDPDGEIIRYDWDFGDGRSGSGPKPRHVYREPGIYDVRLTVTDDSGTIRNERADGMEVRINALPVADAGADYVASPGETLTFSGARSSDPDGQIARYVWNFRDGTSKQGESVQHAFSAPGRYFVQLQVFDDSGHATATDFAETLVFVNDPPTADAGPPVLVAPGDEVQLDASASFDLDGNIGSYRWDFSDQQEPVFAATAKRSFDKPGVYTAQLTVSDDSRAANSISSDTTIIRVNHAPVADAGRDREIDSLRVVFDGSASADADGDGLTYRWDFGDGATATGASVAHTYSTGGVYPVTLTVDDGTGLKNATVSTAITVAINRPPQAMAGDNQRVCVGDTVVFDGGKSFDPEGKVLRYSWDFGDGTTASIVNPTKVYDADGHYRVQLTVEDDARFANSQTKSELMVQVDQAPTAHAGEDIMACTNAEVQFDGSRSTDIDGVVNRFSWVFGDGGTGAGDRPKHIYTTPGTYRATLLIEGDPTGSCATTSTDDVIVTVVEAPAAIIDAPDAAAAGEVIVLDGARSAGFGAQEAALSWDFGDGTTAKGVKAEHSYTEPGTYWVTLTVRAVEGAELCRTATARHAVFVNASPVAEAGENLIVAAGQEVAFDGSQSKDPDGGIVSYVWEFGDGETGMGVMPRHIFRKAGVYEVALTVTDNTALANNSHRDTLVVTVTEPAPPIIAASSAACPADEVSFALQGASPGPAGWLKWRFGDGSGAEGESATHSYASPGRYTVTLDLEDGSGLGNARRFASHPIHVNRRPVAHGGGDRRACPGVAVSFDASQSTDLDGQLSAYRWDFGDGNGADGARASHSYAEPGTYEVTLSVTDDAGTACSVGKDSFKVIVNAPPVADAGDDRVAFTGGAHDRFVLDAATSKDADGDALTYVWQLETGEILFGEKASHLFAAPGKVTATLTASDPHGLSCSSSTDSVVIDVKRRLD